MLTGMTEDQRNEFLERITATTIANQAILKCSISGFPLTADNVVAFVGDFLDPENPNLQELIEKIGYAIDEVLDCQGQAMRLAR
ncbi:hypothetical protein [Rhizobium soli]|uniref:Uncharacterized protein n=1 Tax=Rhizobium soli TaxID=424798 RepID=A0A7X0JM29_9HYPH|nr:hypothetical protein [Rhizobium soli]MBB6509156.1 hypothetical protein [Rhizobium soli]